MKFILLLCVLSIGLGLTGRLEHASTPYWNWIRDSLTILNSYILDNSKLEDAIDEFIDLRRMNSSLSGLEDTYICWDPTSELKLR